MQRTTVRQALSDHPDALWEHHLGEELDTQGLTNRLCYALGAEAVWDEETGTLGTFREIARIVRPDEEDE